MDKMTTEDITEPLSGLPDGGSASGDTSVPPGASGAPAPAQRVRIPDQAHWAGFNLALERGPPDPLSITVPIVPGFEADEHHPVIGEKLRAMRERTQKLAAQYAAAGVPAPVALPADENELRQVLAQRIADNTTAAEKLARATEALARAEGLYATASQAVAELEAAERRHSEAFAAEVTRWAGSEDAAALHANPGAMNLARIKLADAKSELDAVNIAREKLRGEQAGAEHRADNAQQHLNAAVKDVLSAEARTIADEIDRLEQAAGEAWRRLNTIASLPLPTRRGSPALPIRFDDVTARVALNPPRTGRVDMAPAVKSGSEHAMSAQWRGYFDRLLGDAEAQLAD